MWKEEGKEIMGSMVARDKEFSLGRKGNGFVEWVLFLFSWVDFGRKVFFFFLLSWVDFGRKVKLFAKISCCQYFSKYLGLSYFNIHLFFKTQSICLK